MSEMVEKVAKAIYSGHPWRNNHDTPEPRGFDGMSSGWQEAYRSMARAAIEAMREPTEEMRVIDGNDRWNWNCNTCGGPKENWQMMIDEALK